MHTHAHGHPQPPRVDKLPSHCSYTRQSLPQRCAAFWGGMEAAPSHPLELPCCVHRLQSPVPCPITDTGDTLLPKQRQQLRARVCLGLAQSPEERGFELGCASPCQIRSLLLLVSRGPPCFSRQFTAPPAILSFTLSFINHNRSSLRKGLSRQVPSGDGPSCRRGTDPPGCSNVRVLMLFCFPPWLVEVSPLVWRSQTNPPWSLRSWGDGACVSSSGQRIHYRRGCPRQGTGIRTGASALGAQGWGCPWSRSRSQHQSRS